MRLPKINTQKPIYNGFSIRQILKKLPVNMVKIHKIQYIDNCIFVYRNEAKKYNLAYCELTRSANFNLIKTYLYNN